MNYLTVSEGDATVTYGNAIAKVAVFGNWILAEKDLANVPCRPGVYLLIKNDDILYAGSAKRLVLRMYKHEYQQKKIKFKIGLIGI